MEMGFAVTQNMVKTDLFKLVFTTAIVNDLSIWVTLYY